MLKSIEKLVKGFATRVGNHAVKTVHAEEIYTYHDNEVCKVNPYKQTFELDACGYYGYSSTMRTLSDYRHWFAGNCCYLEVFKYASYMADVASALAEGTAYRCYLHDTHLQVTISKKDFGDKTPKYCKVEFSSDIEQNEITFPLVYEFYYRGKKTFNKRFLETVQKYQDLVNQ